VRCAATRYLQELHRALGHFGSFAIAFSMISITTAIFFLLPSLFGTSGAIGIALWLPCAGGVFLIVMVYLHLAARIRSEASSSSITTRASRF
jgi:amino acid transporter